LIDPRIQRKLRQAEVLISQLDVKAQRLQAELGKKVELDNDNKIHTRYLPVITATVTKQSIEDVLTGEISSHSHAGSGLSQAQILTRNLGC